MILYSGCYLTVKLQSVSTGKQRPSRFKLPYFGRERISFCISYVRRIGNHEFKAAERRLTFEGPEQIAAHERNAIHNLVTNRISARNFERRSRDVGSHYRYCPSAGRYRDGYGARSRSDVQNPRHRMDCNKRQSRVDESLSLRSRNQNVPADLEFQRIEFAMTEYIGHGFVLFAPHHH